MTVEEFWNQAFLAALGRLSAPRAKQEADRATKICMDHWHDNCINYAQNNVQRVQDLNIANVRMPGDGIGGFDRSMLSLRTSTPRALSLAMKQGVKKPATKKAAK